jgi:predicted  nucleic acid-binding Zn-ribbon protein
MTATATLLYRLQAIDLAIAQRVARIQAINTLLKNDEQVLQAQQALDTAEQALKPWQARSLDLDLEIKSVVQKAKQADDELYSGRLKNPKAMTEMQEEIASLQRRQSQLEDELLEAMMHIEEGQTEVSDAQKALAQALSTREMTQERLIAEKTQAETELSSLETQREQAAAPLDAASLKAYEALRPRKGGHPVALLRGNSCSACNIEQTSMTAQQVWAGKTLAYCGSCGRILASME